MSLSPLRENQSVRYSVLKLYLARTLYKYTPVSPIVTKSDYQARILKFKSLQKCGDFLLHSTHDRVEQKITVFKVWFCRSWLRDLSTGSSNFVVPLVFHMQQLHNRCPSVLEYKDHIPLCYSLSTEAHSKNLHNCDKYRLPILADLF